MFYIPEIDGNTSVSMEETVSQVNESFSNLEPVKTNNEPRPARNNTDTKVIPYDHIAMETAKAMFLITDSSTDEGFWCPRSVIVDISNRDVTIHKWAKINLMTFM